MAQLFTNVGAMTRTGTGGSSVLHQIMNHLRQQQQRGLRPDGGGVRGGQGLPQSPPPGFSDKGPLTRSNAPLSAGGVDPNLLAGIPQSTIDEVFRGQFGVSAPDDRLAGIGVDTPIGIFPGETGGGPIIAEPTTAGLGAVAPGQVFAGGPSNNFRDLNPVGGVPVFSAASGAGSRAAHGGSSVGSLQTTAKPSGAARPGGPSGPDPSNPIPFPGTGRVKGGGGFPHQSDPLPGLIDPELALRDPDAANAALLREQFDDFMQRFRPVEDELIREVRDPSVAIERAARTAEIDAVNQTLNQLAQRERDIRREGADVSPEERAALDRRANLNLGLRAATGQNLARRNVQEEMLNQQADLINIGRNVAASAQQGLGAAGQAQIARETANANAEFAADQANMNSLFTLGGLALAFL